MKQRTIRFAMVVPVVVVLAGLAAVTWVRYVPSLILDKARQAAHERLGVRLDAVDVEVAPSAVVMHEVRLRRSSGQAPVEVARLVLRPSLRDAWLGRVRLRRVEASGIRVTPGSAIGPGGPGRPAPSRGDEGWAAASPGASPGDGRFRRGFDALGSLGRMLTAGGVVIVEDLRVDTGVADGPLVIERAEIERIAGGLRSSGRVVQRSGRLEWDLDFDPQRQHVSGDLRIENLPATGVAALLPGLPWHRPGQATVDGRLTVRELRTGEPLRVEGELRLRRLWLADDRLAGSPVGPIDLVVSGRAAWDLEEYLLRIERGAVKVNDVVVEVSGRLRPSLDRYLADLELRLPDTRCDHVLRAIPEAVLDRLAGFDWAGAMTGTVRLHVDADDLGATALDVQVDNRCEFVRIPSEVSLERFRGPFEHSAPMASGGVVTFRTGPGTARWVPLERISPFLVHAVLAHEDAGFFRHDGFAGYAIEDALRKNLERSRFAFGASTISMQLARNLFLSREKTLGRKVREALLTWWLESRLTKSEILELYLNVIQYGPDVYGIGPACERYFGCRPSELTLAQSIYLATVLPSPARYDRENFAARRLAGSTRQEMEFLVRHMEDKQRISAAARDAALVAIDRFRFQRQAPRWRPGATAELPVDVLPPSPGVLSEWGPTGEPDRAPPEPS